MRRIQQVSKVNWILAAVPWSLLFLFFLIMSYMKQRLGSLPIVYEPSPNMLELIPLLRVIAIMVLATSLSLLFAPFTFYLELKCPSNAVRISLLLYLMGLLLCSIMLYYDASMFIDWLFH